MNIELLEKYCKVNNISYSILEPMKNHTSFKIGGPADIFITVNSEDQLEDIIKESKRLNINHFILGKGSNLLVSDYGIEGAVISLSGINNIFVDDDEIIAGAGVSLYNLCCFAMQNSLSGLEFAYGIPGSVGGGLFMNAGAYGGEIADVVVSADYFSETEGIGTFLKPQMELGYRTSVFKSCDKIITSVKFKLNKGNKQSIKCKMDEIINKRKLKQPLEFPSGGSTFKRPEGYYAGALIEKNNLKGKCVNGAMVSPKHAGFIVNYNNATCKDVSDLINIIREEIYRADGVDLQPEIVFTGRKSTEV